MLSKREKAWAWYAVVWIPVAVIYAFGLADSQHLPAIVAIQSAATTVLVPALLGVVVWRMTAWLRWPPKSMPRFACRTHARSRQGTAFASSPITRVSSPTWWMSFCSCAAST